MTTETKFKSERDKMGFYECQKDPIFLLQRRRYIYHANHPKIRYDDDLETLVHTSNGKEVTDKTLVEMEAATEVWETDRVFYSREEGETWAENHAHNFRKGSRVYCVCAEGDLKGILLAQDGPIGAAQRPAERLKTGFDYFSCPTCRCCWFRMFGPAKNDELECRNCRWNGPRKAGESARFFPAAESKK